MLYITSSGRNGRGHARIEIAKIDSVGPMGFPHRKILINETSKTGEKVLWNPRGIALYPQHG